MKKSLLSRLMPVLFLLPVSLLLGSCSSVFCGKVNQVDASGKKTGHWIIYSSDDSTRKVSDGYFKNDREYRRFRYYHPNGKRQVRFVYGRHHEYGKSHLKVKFWYPTGKVMQKGTSLLFIDTKEVRYVYDGIWRFYDERGRLTEKTLYRLGDPVEVLYLRPEEVLSDSASMR